MACEDYIDELQRQCEEAIAEFRKMYEINVKPYYDQLTRISRMRQKLSITVTQARELGLLNIPIEHICRKSPDQL